MHLNINKHIKNNGVIAELMFSHILELFVCLRLAGLLTSTKETPGFASFSVNHCVKSLSLGSVLNMTQAHLTTY